MKSLHSQLGVMAAMAMLAAPGMVMEPEPRAIEALPEMSKRRPRVVVTPQPVWENEHVNTRQVRRQRERLAAKGRNDRPPYYA